MTFLFYTNQLRLGIFSLTCPRFILYWNRIFKGQTNLWHVRLSTIYKCGQGKKYFKKHFARNIFSQFSQINTRDMTLFSSRYELAMSCISCFCLLIELTYVYTILWGNVYFSSQNDLRCCSGREHQPYKQLKNKKKQNKNTWELALGRDHLCKQAKNSKAWLTSSVALHTKVVFP